MKLVSKCPNLSKSKSCRLSLASFVRTSPLALCPIKPAFQAKMPKIRKKVSMLSLSPIAVNNKLNVDCLIYSMPFTDLQSSRHASGASSSSMIDEFSDNLHMSIRN